jgi:hypothetical protein
MHQRRARIERIEQEMWTDPGLQRLQFKLFGADGELAGPPVVLVDQQGHQTHHEGQRQHPQHERCPADLRVHRHPQQFPGGTGDKQGHRQQQPQAAPGQSHRGQATQQMPQQEQGAQGANGDPLDPQRGQPEPHQPAFGSRRQRQHQGQGLSGKEYGHQGRRAPQGIERGGGGVSKTWPAMGIGLSCRAGEAASAAIHAGGRAAHRGSVALHKPGR